MVSKVALLHPFNKNSARELDGTLSTYNRVVIRNEARRLFAVGEEIELLRRSDWRLHDSQSLIPCEHSPLNLVHHIVPESRTWK